MTTASICTFPFNTSLQTAPANKNRRNQQLRCSTYLYMCTYVHIYMCIHASDIMYIQTQIYVYYDTPPSTPASIQHLLTKPDATIYIYVYIIDQLPGIALQSLYVHIHACTFVHMHTCAHVHI